MNLKESVTQGFLLMTLALTPIGSLAQGTPSISIITPHDGDQQWQYSRDQLLSIGAQSSGHLEGIRVKFQFDGQEMHDTPVSASALAGQPPTGWWMDWYPRRYPNGDHLLTAVLEDSAGGILATSDPVQIIVNNLTIDQVSVSNLSPTSTQFTWRTDRPASSIVDVSGPSETVFSVRSDIFVTEHSLVVTGLSPDTAYAYILRSRDGAEAISPEGPNFGHFRTSPLPPACVCPSAGSINCGEHLDSCGRPCTVGCPGSGRCCEGNSDHGYCISPTQSCR